MRAVLEHAVGPEQAARFAVLAGDVVPAKKPDPAIYSSRSSAPVPTRRHVVVEDSRNGLLAAVGPGFAAS